MKKVLALALLLAIAIITS